LRFISRIAGKAEEERGTSLYAMSLPSVPCEMRGPKQVMHKCICFVLLPPLLHLLAMTAAWSETSIHPVGAGEYAHNKPSTEQ
jgi:hypothetical protein